jgi:hypothetical protein
MSKNQLFILDDDLCAAMHPGEIVATCEALSKLGLFHLPYPKVDIDLSLFALDRLLHCVDPTTLLAQAVHAICHELSPGIKSQTIDASIHHARILVSDITIDPDSPVTRTLYRTDDTWRNVQRNAITPQSCALLCSALITVLATSNSIKNTSENRLAALGIGTKNKKKPHSSYRYITRISLPHVSTMTTEPGHTGRHVTPHLRRGHIRNQRHGPGYSQTKVLWIAPVFVMADRDFIANANQNLPTREAYKIVKEPTHV